MNARSPDRLVLDNGEYSVVCCDKHVVRVVFSLYPVQYLRKITVDPGSYASSYF